MVDIVEIKHEDFGGSKVDRSLPKLNQSAWLSSGLCL